MALGRSVLGAMVIGFSTNLYVLDGGARATELRGFGPIEFGMTFEKAKETLSSRFSKSRSEQLLSPREETFFDGTSLEIVENGIFYKIFIENLNLYFNVGHDFANGLASHILLYTDPQKKDRERCSTLGRALAREIESAHAVMPSIRPGLSKRVRLRDRSSPETVADLFVFVFERGARIEMTSIWGFNSDCEYSIGYFPPHPSAALF